jgi:hypothetical protein
MKKTLKNAVLSAAVLLAVSGAGAQPVWAGSRSATIRVSCTILPMLEMSSATVPSEEIRLTDTGRLKLLTYTAL